MTVRIGEPIFKTYRSVVYEQPNKKTGEMVRRTSDFVEDLTWFTNHVEKRGGRIISVAAPRQVETMGVSF